MHKNVAKMTPELSVPTRSSETELQITKELRARTLTKRRVNGQFQCGAGSSMVKVEPSVFRNCPPDKLPYTSSENIRDTFCPAKHSFSCTRYLAKTHFVLFKFQQLKM